MTIFTQRIDIVMTKRNSDGFLISPISTEVNNKKLDNKALPMKEDNLQACGRDDKAMDKDDNTKEDDMKLSVECQM